MRPLRVEMEGFAAYRSKVAVPFDGVDFFAITGPTGAGKSSLVDAMVFALFGRVPRLGRREVAPAISAGADRARVAFVFEIDGEEYTVARLAQRTASGGATVREARLQRGDEVLASGADEVTRSVEELLRLSFEDFTRTVVLPQGEFARFLNATRAERQGLLRSLLGLDVYVRVRELAKERAALAGGRADTARHALAGLEPPDEETLVEVRLRKDRLQRLAEELAEEEKHLATLDRAVEEARRRLEGIDQSLESLTGVVPPERLEELDALAVSARSRMVDAEEAERAARLGWEEIRRSLEALPTKEQLEGWSDQRDRLAQLEERMASAPVEEARRRVVAAEEAVEVSLRLLEEAREALTEVRERHLAHTLAGSLVVGEQCPVCLQEIGELPRHPMPVDLQPLEQEMGNRSDQAEEARRQLDEAREALARLEAAHQELEAQRAELLERLSSAPTPEEAAELTARRESLESELEEKEAALASCVEETRSAREALEEVAERSRRVGRDLTAALIWVAALQPPTSESDDVVVAWKELITWRDQTLERLRAERDGAGQALVSAEEVAGEARRALQRLLGDHEVLAVEPYSAQVAAALQAAKSTLESHERTLEQARRLEEVAVSAAEEAAVATALANHLRADGFEQWMMAGALTDLVTGANRLLAQLSSGGYSLSADDAGDFSIVDHRNADEVRPVSTLSGGETFLVSLALALSLAETLAAKGGAGLDAVILDEGFGALDDESLDTAAAVLEELTGTLMVGVITHVKELAARAPVRYEVRRDPGGSQVERVG